VSNHLLLGSRLPASGRAADDRRLVHKFVIDYLRQDGAFLLRLIAHNTNNITTTEVVCALWDFWNERGHGGGTGAAKIGGSRDALNDAVLAAGVSSDALNAVSADSITGVKQHAT